MPYIQPQSVRQALHGQYLDKPQYILTAGIITYVDTYAFRQGSPKRRQRARG